MAICARSFQAEGTGGIRVPSGSMPGARLKERGAGRLEVRRRAGREPGLRGPAGSMGLRFTSRVMGSHWADLSRVSDVM